MIPELDDYSNLRKRILDEYFVGGVSIDNQLIQLIDQGRDFSVINESRFGDTQLPLASRNSIVGGFADVGFIYSQVFGISRLTDPNQTAKNRRVISLPSLIFELEENANLFTRCEFVNSEVGSHRDMAAFWREHKNRLFDKLSGKSESTRTDTDVIDKIFFKILKRLLNNSEIEAIRLHRDKILGHSATPFNFEKARARVAPNQLVSETGAKITLNSIARAQRALCICASFIECCLLWKGNPSYSPTAQYDPFKGLGVGWWDPSNEDSIRQAYNSYGERRELWSRHPLRMVLYLKSIWFDN